MIFFMINIYFPILPLLSSPVILLTSALTVSYLEFTGPKKAISKRAQEECVSQIRICRG